MKKNLNLLFNIYYKKFGLKVAIWTLLRVLILPFYKLDKIIPKISEFVDIGCGNGGLSNYLVISSHSRLGIGIDLSKIRISLAKKTVGNRKNIIFRKADIVKAKLPEAGYYLIVDVLHHVSYFKQEILLGSIIKKMNNNTKLIIKEVDKSNTTPFLFGHLLEKILYPKEKIYVRSKVEWMNMFKKLGLQVSTQTGAFYFPDSTVIFICRKIK